jgi:hypothetical protein
MQIRSTSILLLSAVVLGGCVRWKAESSPAAALTGRGHRVVRLTTADGGQVELRDPQVSRDSVVGWSEQPGARLRGRVALPLASVTRVERQVKADGALAIGAGVVLAGLLAVAHP